MELVGRDPPPWEYLSSRALPGRERLGRHGREGAVTSDGGGAVNTGAKMSSVLFHPGPARLAHFPECCRMQRRNVNIFLPDDNQCVVQWIMVLFSAVGLCSYVANSSYFVNSS